MTQQLLDQSAQLVVLYRQLAHLPCLPSPRTPWPRTWLVNYAKRVSYRG